MLGDDEGGSSSILSLSDISSDEEPELLDLDSLETTIDFQEAEQKLLYRKSIQITAALVRVGITPEAPNFDRHVNKLLDKYRVSLLLFLPMLRKPR